MTWASDKVWRDGKNRPDWTRDRTVYWDDMRIAAAGINPPGLVSDPDRDTDTGCWLFSTSATEMLVTQVQLPHQWKEGSYLVPHVHWQKTTSASGDVYWQLEYKWAPIGGVMDASWTTLTVTDTVDGTPDNDTADEHLISSFGELDGTGKEISDMLIFKLSRVGGNAADTYGADARLLEYDVHVQKDAPGSIQPFRRSRDDS